MQSARSGSFSVAVDEKGRLAVPAELRKAAGGPQDDRLFITQFRIEGLPCLDAFFPAAWQQILEKLATKNRFDPDVMRFQRAYVWPARECPLDAQGRVVIPAELRDYAGIRREARVTADAHKFCIWDRETWQRLHAQDVAILDDLAKLQALDL